MGATRPKFLCHTALMSTALVLGACGLIDDTPTYRYRMTVEVDTPEGLKSGSSVIEVDSSLGFPGIDFSQQSWGFSTRGEAAMVDLGERGVLFALLRSEQSVDWASNVLLWLIPMPDMPDGTLWKEASLQRFQDMLDNKELIELPQTLPGTDYSAARPMLVTFGDLSDPTSVAKVDPDNLAASFGEGFSLRRITVQLTDDPVTTGIDKRLPWLTNLDAYRTDPDNPFTNTLPSEIGGLRSR